MGIFKRLQDILSANLGEMVESYEDPAAMLKQAIREMETAIAEAKQETAKAMAGEKLVGKELAENQRLAREWQQRAEKALLANDEAQARQALVRKQEHDKIAAALVDQATANGEASKTLRTQLEAMKAKLAEAKRNLATLSARKKAADVRKKSVDAHFKTDAFAKYERISEKVTRAEAEADALRELESGLHADADRESAPVGSDSAIDDELANLKRKLKK